MRDLLIRSATSIRKRKEYTHGGPTDSAQERKMQGGVLIISVYQRAAATFERCCHSHGDHGIGSLSGRT